MFLVWVLHSDERDVSLHSCDSNKFHNSYFRYKAHEHNGYVCSLLIVMPVIRLVYGLFRTLWNPLSSAITAQDPAVSIWVNTVSRSYYTYPIFSGFSREVSHWFTVIVSLRWRTLLQKYLFTLPSPRLKFNICRLVKSLKFFRFQSFQQRRKYVQQ